MKIEKLTNKKKQFAIFLIVIKKVIIAFLVMKFQYFDEFERILYLSFFGTAIFVLYWGFEGAHTFLVQKEFGNFCTCPYHLLYLDDL